MKIVYMKYIYSSFIIAILCFVSTYAQIFPIPTGLSVQRDLILETINFTTDADDPSLSNQVSILNANNNRIAYFLYNV
mgnify:CR=1 FL=1